MSGRNPNPDTPDKALNRLTLSQVEALLLIQRGRKVFRAQAAKSINGLVERELVTADFDISDPDPLRGRVYEIWRNCQLTDKGRNICDAFKVRYAPLITESVDTI